MGDNECKPVKPVFRKELVFLKKLFGEKRAVESKDAEDTKVAIQKVLNAFKPGHDQSDGSVPIDKVSNYKGVATSIARYDLNKDDVSGKDAIILIARYGRLKFGQNYSAQAALKDAESFGANSASTVQGTKPVPPEKSKPSVPVIDISAPTTDFAFGIKQLLKIHGWTDEEIAKGNYGIHCTAKLGVVPENFFTATNAWGWYTMGDGPRCGYGNLGLGEDLVRRIGKRVFIGNDSKKNKYGYQVTFEDLAKYLNKIRGLQGNQKTEIERDKQVASFTPKQVPDQDAKSVTPGPSKPSVPAIDIFAPSKDFPTALKQFLKMHGWTDEEINKDLHKIRCVANHGAITVDFDPKYGSEFSGPIDQCLDYMYLNSDLVMRFGKKVESQNQAGKDKKYHYVLTFEDLVKYLDKVRDILKEQPNV